MTFSTLASPGVSLQGGGGSGGGGGGTPGGSNTQLQYNSSGAFAGAAGLTTDGTSLTITGGNLTMSGNISAPAWTTSGVRIKGVPGTLTDTTSSGTVAAAYTNVFGGNTIAASNATTFTDYFTTFINAPTNGANVTFTRSWALGLGGSLQIASASQLGWSTDLILTRRGAANLRLGAADAAAPVAQTLSVQSVVAGTSNTAGANLTITGSQGTGTGAGGSIIFQVAPAGSSGTAQNALATAWSISGAGHFLAGADNSYDIGASGANRPRNLYVGGNGVFGGTVTAGLYLQTPAAALNGNGGVYFGSASANRAELQATGVGILTIGRWGTGDVTLGFGGTTSSFPALKRSSTTLQARLADDSAFAGFASANMQAATAYTVATLPGTPGTGMIARVTDALAPTIGATVTGGGAAYALVNYNGANWTAIGV